MENNQKGKESDQPQQTVGEQNPTLNEKGSSVADYGNVMGGSSDETAQQGSKDGATRPDSDQTTGNP